MHLGKGNNTGVVCATLIIFLLSLNLFPNESFKKPDKENTEPNSLVFDKWPSQIRAGNTDYSHPSKYSLELKPQ